MIGYMCKTWLNKQPQFVLGIKFMTLSGLFMQDLSTCWVKLKLQAAIILGVIY